jgi:hypothetical protein
MSWTDAFFFHDSHLSEYAKRTTECQHDVPHPPGGAQLNRSAHPTHSRAAGLLASGNGSLRGLVDVLEFQLGLLPGGFQDLDGVGDILF